MHIKILSIGDSMSSWQAEGVKTYTQRLPSPWRPQLIEIPRPKGANKGKDRRTQCRREGEALLAKVHQQDWVIALDPAGKALDTQDWSERLQHWASDGKNIALLIGGSDGLSEDCLARANEKWSLSKLTFPHMMVRVIVAEQLYRAWTILQGHPYDK